MFANIAKKITPKVGNIIITSFQKQMSDTGSLDKHFLLLHMIVLLNHPLSLSQIQEVWTWLDIITTQNHHQCWYNLQANSVLVEIMNNIASEKAKIFKSQISCQFIFSLLKLLLNNPSNLLLYSTILPLTKLDSINLNLGLVSYV